MLFVQFARSLSNVERLLHKRSIGVSHETVRYCLHASDR